MVGRDNAGYIPTVIAGNSGRDGRPRPVKSVIRHTNMAERLIVSIYGNYG